MRAWLRFVQILLLISYFGQAPGFLDQARLSGKNSYISKVVFSLPGLQAPGGRGFETADNRYPFHFGLVPSFVFKLSKLNSSKQDNQTHFSCLNFNAQNHFSRAPPA